VVVLRGLLFPEQLDLWRACREEGARVHIVGTDYDFYRGRWPWHPRQPEDIECTVLKPVSPRLSGGQAWWWYKGLGQVFRRVRPHLAHILSEPWGVPVAEALIYRKTSNLDVGVCVHGADNLYHHGRPAEKMIRQAVLKRVLPRIDGFVSLNDEGIRLARDAGLSADAPVAVSPGVAADPERFRPPSPDEKKALRSRFGLPQDSLVAGFFGRFVPEKGLLDLLDAMRSLEARAPFLAIWGAGPLEAHVVRELDSGVVRGSRLGAIDFSEVPDAMRACDLVVMPSKTTPGWAEQFGRVAIEAMLSGSVVIAYSSGALPQVVGGGGVLVEEGDVQALASAIAELAGDETKRREQSVRGREWVLNRFAPDVLAKTLMRFWEDVLSQRRIER
jgi:glycosyltransferase involved in cell wall biosynthesis